MNRREFLACAAAAMAGAASRRAFAQPAAKRPNIILILADDLGYGHLGCYGQQHIRTPHLDALAASGMRFTQCYSGGPVCGPARCSLMTGLHGGHVSVNGTTGGAVLDARYVTVAEVMKGAGYATGCFGKWGLGDAGTEGVPTRQGFDEFLGYLHHKHAHYAYTDYLWHNERPYPLPGNADGENKQYAHDVFTEKCFDWIRAKKDEPFFCYYAPTIPHHEWTAPEESLKEYAGTFDESNRPEFKWREGYAFPKEPKANVAAMISHLDKDIGRLTALLDELAIAGNTLVLFSSDNGGDRLSMANADFFRANGDLRGYKQDVYEGGIRVPGIASWPGIIPAGAVNDHPWYFPDVLPTFAELAGAEAPAGLDGLSIVPALTGRGNQQKHPFMYWERHAYGKPKAVRMGDWKAVWPDPDGPIELYDLAKDPGETTDLADAHPAVAERARTLIAAQRTEFPPQIEPGAPDGRLYR